MDSLAGAVIAVTGGARGIGLGVCEELMRQRASVAILDIDAKTGRQAAAKLNNSFSGSEAIFVTCNVADEKSFAGALDEVVKELGCVNGLCNNAGLSETDLDTLVKVNLYGVVFGTCWCFANCRNSSGPKVVVNVASSAGLYPLPIAPLYTATKHAVVGYSRAFSPRAKQAGLTVHCMCPAFTDTDMVRSGKDNPAFRRAVAELGVIDVNTVAKGIVQLFSMREPEVIRCTVTKPFYPMFRPGKL
mmetsp:Transcript_5724/g.17038  ORF Transcript_5724/g.17038 Transcript_5724/m.17038 type:complete len:245 (+) Transcript_5724:231-965(+)